MIEFNPIKVACSLSLTFNEDVKIKIFNKEGFSQANIVVPLYKDGNRQEYLRDLKASTFNWVNGNPVESVMDKKALFEENRSKYTTLTKFTLPNIKDGSIIEYRYNIQSPLLFNFRQWDFQSDIPKVSSEYVAFIPANYNYIVVLRGFYKLSDQKSEINRECLRINGVNIDCSKMTYIMNNVPAFVEEDYMTAASNFKSAMYFELSDVQMLNGSKQNYTKDWKSVDYDLVSEKMLGSQMKRKDLFKDVMPGILTNTTDDLSKAKAVYNYIKKQIKWNNYYGKYSEESIKNALDTRFGNVADINLMLVAMLRYANLDANNDGKLDLIAGNKGLNTQMKAPVTLLYDDFDANGTKDPLMAYQYGDKLYPMLSRDDVLSQLPGFKKRFVTYETYAKTSFSDLLTAKQRENAQYFEVETFC